MSIEQLNSIRDSTRPQTETRAPIAILAAIGGAHDDEAAIAVAADLAYRHRSPVTVVNTFEPTLSATMPRGFSGGMMAMQVGAALDEERVAIAGRIRSLVDRYARQYGFTPDALEADGYLRLARPTSGCWDTLMRELPLVDLAVLAQSSVEGDGPWVGPLGETLMAARTPVYVARDQRTTAGRPAAIAWDGGFEAARAIRAALPLLRDSASVAILQAPSKLNTAQGERADPKRLMSWLSAHGVNADTVKLARQDKIGEGLLAAAREFGAALFVAGAYHHSRIKEALFGGPTRAFLEAGDGPHLLVAH